MKRKRSPVESLVRHLDWVLRSDDVTEDGAIAGLAVPFDTPTRIDSWWEGTFDEQFRRGAFKRSIGMKTPIMQFDHGYDFRIGSLPIGEWTALTEAKRGLELGGGLFDSPDRGWLLQAIDAQVLRMSIRFRPLEVIVEERDDDVPLHTVTEADLIEAGPVVFPAYETTEIGLKSVDLDALPRSMKVRLAQALAADLDRHTGGDPLGPGTAPARAPAASPDPTSGHSGSAVSPLRRRAVIAELEEVLAS